MADQTQVNQRTAESPSELPSSLGKDVGGFAHVLLRLVELQSQLFFAEAREARQRSIVPSVLFVTSLILGASCCPIALIAFALSLAQLTSLSIAAAFLIVLAAGLASSLTLLITSSMLIRNSSHLFRRSQEEFLHNYQWFKAAFKSNRTTPRDSTDCSKDLKR